MIEFFFVFLEAELSSLIFLLYFNRELSKLKKKNRAPPPPPQKKSLYFGKWNFLALILINFLYFRKMEILKKTPYIFEKWNSLVLILGNFSKFSQKKAFPTFQEMVLFYISGNGNPEKNHLYFIKRKLFLYFRKWKPPKNSLYFRKLNFLIFEETETLKKFLYFRKQLSVLKK